MKMTATKKRLLSGMLAGAVLLAGTISYAGAAAAQDNGQANARMERRDNMRPGQMPQLDAGKIAKHVAEQFGVKESEVLAALNDRRNFRDIAYTAMLAKISGKSFSDVLAMKTKDNHWRDVQKSLGVTKEQMRAEQIEMTAAHLALSGDLTRAQAKEMLQNGYRPMDIAMAARIAKEKNEDIQIVLDSKKLNNKGQLEYKALSTKKLKSKDKTKITVQAGINATQLDTVYLGKRIQPEEIGSYFYPAISEVEEGSFEFGGKHYKAFRVNKHGDYEIKPALRQLFRIIEQEDDDADEPRTQKKPRKGDDEEI